MCALFENASRPLFLRSSPYNLENHEKAFFKGMYQLKVTVLDFKNKFFLNERRIPL